MLVAVHAVNTKTGAGQISSHLQQRFQQGQRLYQSGRLEDAAALFSELNREVPAAREPLEFLVMIALQQGRADVAIGHLEQLLRQFPGELTYFQRLMDLLERSGRAEHARKRYRALCKRRPELLAMRFNYAALLRRMGDHSAALKQYQRCLDDGIDEPEEVLAVMGSTLADLHRHEEAERAFQRALKLRPGYPPALYNYGLLHEEFGRWPEARALFEKIGTDSSLYAEALARLAHGAGGDDDRAPLLARIQSALASARLSEGQRESLHYAAGKLLDDAAQYAAAFAAYEQGNRLSQKRVARYDRSEQEKRIDSLITRYPAQAGHSSIAVSEEPLVFICGMFRSGSTLLEQILAAHAGVVAGGELDYFPSRLTLDDLARGIDDAAARRLGQGYVTYLQEHFSGGAMVTNKRPDNFHYLGLLLRLFPNARVLHTVRDPRDNALSVYFQQLASSFPYANDLEDIAHFQRQERRLMQHWQHCYPDNLVEVAYADLVEQAQATITTALAFLGLQWDSRCLDFHEQDNRVRTASVSQVRRPLYSASVGRWRNYREQLAPYLHALAGETGAA